MDKKIFEELLSSVREGGEILRGKKAPTRKFEFDQLDIKQLRDDYRLSQNEFASLLGVSVRTLQNWEQGRRQPEGAARILLQVVAKHPDAVWDVVSAKRISRSKSVAS